MVLSRDNDYAMYLYTCNRCRTCAVEPSPEHRPVCPSYSRFGYFAYSGGGKGYVAQGIIEGKVKPSAEALAVAMNCLMCGACVKACPPGFDINNFIRDLRDHLVQAGFYLNDAHRRILDNLRAGTNPWGKKLPPSDLPAFTGKEELLVWRGCQEKITPRLLPAAAKILEAAGLTWGVLPDEPCCVAPLLELGDREAFTPKAERVLALLEEISPTRILFLCPHCAAALAADYAEIGDFPSEAVTLSALLAELVQEGKIGFRPAAEEKVTCHDPCRLARWLEETTPLREVLTAIPGVELIEMERHGEWSWCCGAGGLAVDVVPELADYTARERVAEARRTGASRIITACSWCTRMLGRRAGPKQKLIHLADLVAEKMAL